MTNLTNVFDSKLTPGQLGGGFAAAASLTVVAAPAPSAPGADLA